MVELGISRQNGHSSHETSEVGVDASQPQVPEAPVGYQRLVPINTRVNGNAGGRFAKMGGNCEVGDPPPRQKSILRQIRDNYEAAGVEISDGSVQYQLRKLLDSGPK